MVKEKTDPKKMDNVEEVDNMSFWNKVCETNPGITKDVSYGARKFTAIDAQHQLKRATELWGPYGGKWGVKNINWGYVGDGKATPIELTIEASFYSPLGEFEISSDTKYAVGGDCRKKLLTDLTTKALSKLGFNSDVFEGKFDDNKYVAEMTAKHNGGDEQTKTGQAKTTAPEHVSKITPDGQAHLAQIQTMLEAKLEKGMSKKDAGNTLLMASSFDGDQGHVKGWDSLAKLIDDAHAGIATESRLKIVRDKLKPLLNKGAKA